MRKFLFLNGSTRPLDQPGNTLTLAKLAAQQLAPEDEQTWIRLAELTLPDFVDLRHSTAAGYAMPVGDAKSLLDATLAATDLVFVSPVYWFSVPSTIKTYLDHWSGWMRVPGVDFKTRMQGKNLWVIATSGDRAKAQAMFDSYQLCAKFLDMSWQGVLWGKGGAPEAVLADTAACQEAKHFLTGEPLAG